MKITLEQVFYGRGQFGYGVLSSSPNGKTFGAAVESLCESIGSPDAFLTWEPFLVNKHLGDYCLMCRVQPGEPDSCGRSTILYHILIGLKSEMITAGLDAFALQEKGLFRKAVVEHPETISVEGRSQRPSSGKPFDIRFPAVVSVPDPDQDLIRGLLGSDSVRRSWATFAFHPMDGFDLYALNVRATKPHDVVCYDATGKILSQPISIVQPGEEKMSTPKKSPLFGFSLVVNVILIAVCLFLILCRHSVTNDDLVTKNAALEAEVSHLRNELAQKEKSLAGLVSRDEVMRELREKFKVEYRGETIDKEMMSEILNAFGKSETGKIVPPYIRFVNETILRLSSTKQE